jgi:hypothetical protein
MTSVRENADNFFPTQTHKKFSSLKNLIALIWILIHSDISAQNSAGSFLLIFLVILSYLIEKKLKNLLDKAILHPYSWPRGVKWFIVEGK